MNANMKPTNSSKMKLGDFTGLAQNYSQYRAGYSNTVLHNFLNQFSKPASDLVAADVGAGTGIWTRQLARAGLKQVFAIEPNEDMRSQGAADSKEIPAISFHEGAGDATNLDDVSVDMVSMASSFHWVDFETGTREFHRILNDGGFFLALWNPRVITEGTLLAEIEDLAHNLAGSRERVSSGRSGRAEKMTSLLESSPLFDNVKYMEDTHTVRQSLEHYIGVWRSVNDLQTRMGSANFNEFLSKIEKMVIDNGGYVETTYATRAWSSQKA